MYLNIRKTIEEIKFYLPIIFILPPILGGIWQLVELFRIDPSYIRFFSATQLLPDGLLMLLILIVSTPLLGIVFILHKVIPHILDNKEKIKITTQSNLKHFYILKSKQSKIKYKSECNDTFPAGALIALIIFMSLLFITLYIDIKKDEIKLFSFLIRMFISFSLLSISLLAITDILKCSELKLLKEIKRSKIFFIVSVILYAVIVLVSDFFIILFVPILIVMSIHQVYLFPYNLINVKNIDNKIDKNYKSNKLLYVNDKYIFIEQMDKNESKSIQIIKFDVLFNDIKK